VTRSFFSRQGFHILLGLVFLLPILLLGTLRAIRGHTNKVEDWLPASLSETSELAWFRERFVGDQFVVVSWEGCRLGESPTEDDPRIERLAEVLMGKRPAPIGSEAARLTSACRRYFRDVNTGRRLLEKLASPPLDLTESAAVARLKGTLLGEDNRQTCLVVTLTDAATRDLRDVLGFGVEGIFRTARKPGVLVEAIAACGIPLETVHLGGPPVDNVAIDEEGEKTLIRLTGLAGILGLGLSWWSLRSVRLTIIVFFCGILSAAAALATVYYSGATMDAVLMSMPSLVYVLAISGSVHLIHYYQVSVASSGQAGAVERAIALGWKPSLLCNVTTAIGLVSLFASDLVPIRKFGIYSAVGVMETLIVLFVVLPAAIQLWVNRSAAGLESIRSTSREPDEVAADSVAAASPSLALFEAGEGFEVEQRMERNETHESGFAYRFWDHLGTSVMRHHRMVAVTCCLVVALAAYGLRHVTTSINLLELFDPHARILKDYAWLETHLGKLVPMELVLRFPPGCQSLPEDDRAARVGGNDDSLPVRVKRRTFLERMEAVEIVQSFIEREFGPAGRDVVGGSLSAVTFGPQLSSMRGGGTMSLTRRAANQARLESNRQSFLESGYLKVDPDDGSELWRISLRAGAFRGVDYGQLVQDLRDVVNPVLGACRARDQVLEALLRARNSSAGSRICILCPPAVAQPALDSTGERLSNGTPPRVDSQRIFLASLAQFLSTLRARVTAQRMEPGETVRDWAARLSDADCVVIAGDIDAPQRQLLAKEYGSVVDVCEWIQPSAPAVPLTVDSQSRDSHVSTVYTGIVPIVYKAQRMLLDSLIESTCWSFATITPLMMFLSRGVGAGLVSMLPNSLPVLVIFGAMGWGGIAVDIGSMMAASIALGVAVDDTIHFLTWFRRDLAESQDRLTAIRSAYNRCATPTLQAAVISGLGLSVFALSTFTPTQRFGYLMLTILFAGVVAELIFFPALLAGPLGRAFHVRRAANATKPGPHWNPRRWADCPTASDQAVGPHSPR
jgi:predicted RND superfamily exporter protein